MKETRRYIITSSGEKMYITDADIKQEVYCDVCDRPLGEDHIYLQVRGGWNKNPVAIPGYSEVMMLHESCTPPMILGLMQPVPKITSS